MIRSPRASLPFAFDSVSFYFALVISGCAAKPFLLMLAGNSFSRHLVSLALLPKPRFRSVTSWRSPDRVSAVPPPGVTLGLGQTAT